MTNNKAIGILAIVVETAKGRCFVTDEAISDAYDMAISALQAQEAKTQLSAEGTTSDLISRRVAVEAVEHITSSMSVCVNTDECHGMKRMQRQAVIELANLPFAQPERKTGRWLIREGISDAQCSECKMYFRDVYDMDNSDAFCRHCGAKMEGLKVVEDE